MKTDHTYPPKQRDGLRPETIENLFALGWIALAWIVGSLIFEVTATGADFNPSIKTQPAVRVMQEKNETTNKISKADSDPSDGCHIPGSVSATIVGK